MKCRLDKILLDRALVTSREIAQSLIIRGDVLVEDRPVTKPGQAVKSDANIRIRGELPKYVSRGGDKLEGALRHFAISIENETIIDLGASTGGFTDCLLQEGAARIYAVDVGTAQLAEKLRQDSRVTVMEQLHAKNLTPDLFNPLPSFAVIDVSFISLRKVLPYLETVLSSPWRILALVKPQFELEPQFVAKGGVVPEEAQQLHAVSLVRSYGESRGWISKGYSKSGLRGSKSGNQEYFILFESPDFSLTGG